MQNLEIDLPSSWKEIELSFSYRIGMLFSIKFGVGCKSGVHKVKSILRITFDINVLSNGGNNMKP